MPSLDAQPLANHGNFWALLQFRVSAGDSILEEHLLSHARNCSYTSADIQNQIVLILGDQIRSQIVAKLNKAKWFTMIADEVTDTSNKEQLSLVVNGIVREDLLSFIECDTGVSGSALADKMLSCLNACDVDPSMLRGQAYDGAVTCQGIPGEQQPLLQHSIRLLCTYTVPHTALTWLLLSLWRSPVSET